ncbi:alpha-ketoglutarate-dependent taurine dioxygenase [Saccharothrix ecbatanensis]|uniref:Alpha-ketoglutarate-dependent taurine dioxygenase n=1 Tax=Saccharothrix ecbatanensis TaxID=1105145 RepID=A0A7W9HJT9_9PSEU|nr:TauD/TfdA family dioxygenase [Saccharothrix ecbatanensis]MBB5803617.1 alpha-ketoglutarate-dependent taurine dioxygenase [Saccharothrix ecbatanensis]
MADSALAETPFAALRATADVEVVEHNGTRLCRVSPHGDNPRAWITENVELVRAAMLDCGAVMIKQVPAEDDSQLGVIAEQIGGRTLDYTERSTPRSKVTGKVYTSTHYPADQSIPQHNESAYSANWPDNLFFYCALAAETGGETPVADSAAVLAQLPEELVDRFASHGVIYTRAYHDAVGLPWQEVFQTNDREEVEKYCAANGITTQWSGDMLRTRQLRPALVTHPLTGKTVWFNQAHLFHVNNLPEDVRESMLSIFSEEDLPRHAYCGDGSPITDEEFDLITRAFDPPLLAEPWETGDLLMIDNILVSHGRRPFTGDRRILVAMTKRPAS